MNNTLNIQSKINLPPVSQIGVVVKELDPAMEYYTNTLGLGNFDRIIDVLPDNNWYMGEKTPVRFRIGQAKWGAMEFELVQPMEGRSIHRDFLNINGEGLHHLGVIVDDYEKIVDSMNKNGFAALQIMETYFPEKDKWVRSAFFDTNKVGGVILEILQRPF